MAQLLAAQSQKITTFRKSDAVSGTITKLTPSEILVDLGAKSEAFVLEKDRRILRSILSLLHVGESVTVTIVSVESEMGYPVVSLRRHIDAMLWEKLEKFHQDQEPVAVTITEETRGGFLAEGEMGFVGFLPHSQVSPASFSRGSIQGSRLEVFVHELARVQRKIVLSQKRVLREEEFARATQDITPSCVVEVTVSQATHFGIFVVLHRNGVALDGFIHISEVSWEPLHDLLAFVPGSSLTCEVIGVDRDARRIELSLKRLTADPFQAVAKQFTIDEKVLGKVARVSSYGVHVTIHLPGDGETEAVIRKEKVPPNMQFEVGSEVSAVVAEIDQRRRKIFLVPVLKEKPIGYR